MVPEKTSKQKIIKKTRTILQHLDGLTIVKSHSGQECIFIPLFELPISFVHLCKESL